MRKIDKQYIVDEQNRKIAVQIPIETFEKMEEILENYAKELSMSKMQSLIMRNWKRLNDR